MNNFEPLSDEEIVAKVEECRSWPANLRSAFGAQLFVGAVFLVITIMHSSSDSRQFMDLMYWGTLSAIMILTAAISKLVRGRILLLLEYVRRLQNRRDTLS